MKAFVKVESKQIYKMCVKIKEDIDKKRLDELNEAINGLMLRPFFPYKSREKAIEKLKEGRFISSYDLIVNSYLGTEEECDYLITAYRYNHYIQMDVKLLHKLTEWIKDINKNS